MFRRITFQLLLACVTIVAILFFAGGLSAQGNSEDAFERVKRIQERHSERLLGKEGIVGTAIGLNPGGQYVVVIMLEKENVPEVPAQLDGIPVRRMVTGTIRALIPPKDRAPKPPRALTATAVSDSEINLDWKDNREAGITYRVYRSMASNGSYTQIGSSLVSEYSDTGLAGGTTYYYVVTAFDGKSESSNSSEASATTAESSPGNPPTAPTNLSASTTSSTEINLAWTDNATDEQGFEIARKTGTGELSQIATVGPDTSTYADTGLTASTTYIYRVRAYNAHGSSGYSNEATATTGSGPQLPAAPSLLEATAAGSSQIDLTWTDNADNETGYRIERDSVQIDTVGSDVTSYSDTGLEPSTPYTYRVRAYNSDGDSEYSNEATATTNPPAELPTDPTARFPRPVPIGVSTGHFNITAGTIACRVKDALGDNVYALSNNHVYADENAASLDDPVLQPGPHDGGTVANDTFGRLHDFEPVYMYPLGLNTMDAAIAVTTTDDLGKATLPAGYGTPANAIAAPSLDMAVQKYGRTTRLTQGTITGLNAFILVQYSSGLAIFTGQIMIEGTGESFSAPGDSGSLVVTDDLSCNPVGLLFAGSATVTYANPIGPVLARFSVTVDGK